MVELEPSQKDGTALLALIRSIDATAERCAARCRGSRCDDAAHILSASADRAKLTVVISLLRLATDHRNGRRVAVRTVAGVLATTALVDVAKSHVGRMRPAVGAPLKFGVRPQTSSSFPSGHAVSAAMVAVSIAEDRKSWRVPLALFAASVGWSRVQVGLHHASDVAGGLAIGTVAGFALRRLVPLRGRRKP